MAHPSLEIGPQPSVEDVQFLERLGDGLGAGRFKARFGDAEALVSLLLEQPGRTDRGRFLEWARRLRAVSHPVVPEVVRVETELLPAYVAQAYVEGQNLEARLALRGEALPPVDAATIALHVAAGLRAVHRAGVAHGSLSARSVLLVERPGGAEAVRLVGWAPLSVEGDAAAGIRADVRGVGELLYLGLSGLAPPSTKPAAELEGLEGRGGAFDDVLMDFVESERDLGGLGELAVRVMNDAAAFPTTDAVIDALVPHLRVLLDTRYAELAAGHAIDRDLLVETARHRERLQELESKLRWVRNWLRENGERIDRAEAAATVRDAEAQRLRHLELELGMLLDRALPPSLREPRVEPPPLPDSAPPLPVAPPRRAEAPAEAPAAEAPRATPAEAAERPEPAPMHGIEDERPRRARSGAEARLRPASRGARVVGVTVAVAAIAGVAAAAWWLTHGEAPTSTATGARATPPADAPTPVATPAPPTRAVAPTSAVAPASAPAVPASAAVAPASVPAAPPVVAAPPGMVLVTAGPATPGLAPAQRALAAAQCKADLAKRGDAERRCTDDAFEPAGPPVAVPAFFIDVYEVSQGRYGECERARACPPATLRWEIPEQPAVGVDLAAATAFCRWAGGRLPTGDEWLRAARGDDARLYPWGDEPPVVDDKHKANFGAAGRNTATMGNREDGHTYAAPVDVFATRGQSPFGVVNLAGNVREWTTAAGGPAVMGGGWRSPSYELRVSRREPVAPDEVANDLGFRCVKDVGADERTPPRAPDGP